MRYVICAGVVAAIGLVVCSASAYNPPEDTVGNLHVRIEGPATVAEVGRSIEYKVIIENGGSQVAHGDVISLTCHPDVMAYRLVGQ